MSGYVPPVAAPPVLAHIAHDLHEEFRGVFSEPTIFGLVRDTHAEFTHTATVTRWLAVGTEVSVRRRLRALADSQTRPSDHKPSVLFLCEHDAGPSQIAAIWFEHCVGDQAEVWSTGPNPSPALAAAITSVMAEVGITIASKPARASSAELVRAADAVVTIGHEDSCPLIAGKHYEDWDLAVPTGVDLAEIRQMRDQIRNLVTHLAHEVGVSAA